MNMLLDQISELNKKEKTEDNLFVKNIIVNKDQRKKQSFPFIATDKWVEQLGNRLQINFKIYLIGTTFLEHHFVNIFYLTLHLRQIFQQKIQTV